MDLHLLQSSVNTPGITPLWIPIHHILNALLLVLRQVSHPRCVLQSWFQSFKQRLQQTSVNSYHNQHLSTAHIAAPPLKPTTGYTIAWFATCNVELIVPFTFTCNICSPHSCSDSFEFSNSKNPHIILTRSCLSYSSSSESP